MIESAVTTGAASGLSMERPTRDQVTRYSQTLRTMLRASTLAFSCFLIFCVADTLLNRFAIGPGWTILWPLNGIVIAMLISRPRSDWPAMLIGIEAGVTLGEFLNNNTIRLVLWERLFSLTEVTLSAWLLPRFTTLEHWLRERRIFLRFVGALVVGPALTGVYYAIFAELTKHQPFGSAFDDWATADSLGIAAIMPLALSFRSLEMAALFKRKAILKTLAVFAIAVAGVVCVFSVSKYPLLFLLYPTLLLVDSMLGFSGAAVAVAVMSCLAVYLTTHGMGPFGSWPTSLPVTRDVALQIFLGFHLVALFPTSIMIMERKRMAAELRDSNAQLLLLASLDGLTGIANRRSLDEHFAQEWTRAIRVQTPLALVMIDIDHFKQFNDLYGHHAGDRCLQAVAAALQNKMQRGQDHLARFGGEEFALLLPHTDLQGAMHIAEHMRLAVLELAIPHRSAAAGQVTISLGCSAFTPTNGEHEHLLLEMADSALYKAKQAGRNCVCAFEKRHREVAVPA